MFGKRKVTAIILVAGNSTRFGSGDNKNLQNVKEKPVLAYSLEAFNKNQYVDKITVTVRKKDENEVRKIIKNAKCIKPVQIIIGGETRKDSVYNSIKNDEADIVIIHDGARPMIKQHYITNCIEAMKMFKGVTIGAKSKDTIKIADNSGIIINSTQRENTWIIQTPQCFQRSILFQMHKKFNDEGITDDCMLLEKGGYKVKILEGDYTNIKITTKEDMNIINEFMKQ